MLWDCLRPLVGVPERLDALQDLDLHLEIVQVHLERIEGRDARDGFFGSGQSGEVVRRHVGPLFVLYHKVVF